MFLLAIILSALVAPAMLRPQEPASASATAVTSTPIPIISQTEDSSPDGSFQFSYETGNGIKVDEKGYLKPGQNASEQIQVIEGNVSYTDSTGAVINLRYIADENGYQPTGDHLPTAPQVPEYIAKSSNLSAQPKQPIQRSAQISEPVAAAAPVAPEVSATAAQA